MSFWPVVCLSGAMLLACRRRGWQRAHRSLSSHPLQTRDLAFPHLSLDEVPNRNLYIYLCESTSAFVNGVLKVEVKAVVPGKLTLEMPFTPELAGNPRPRSMHGGVIAAAIDHAAGFACWSTFDNSVCSTLNMRIDYLKPLLDTDKSLVLDAVVEHIDDEKNVLRSTVVCYDRARTKQVAVGRAVFNRYTPKLGVMDNVKPLFRKMWDYKSLNFFGRAFLDHYQVLYMTMHKYKFNRKQRNLPRFSIADEKSRLTRKREFAKDILYNGMNEKEFAAVVEEEPEFGRKILGLRVLSIAPGVFTTVIPFKEYFMGNFVTGALHGGVMASLIDQTAGMCARSIVHNKEQRVSTVDFTVDYLAPALCFEHIICEARVVSRHSENSEKSARDGNLIYVDATCWNESRSTIIGVAKLTFNVYNRVK